jgi:hypothetical protein
MHFPNPQVRVCRGGCRQQNLGRSQPCFHCCWACAHDSCGGQRPAGEEGSVAHEEQAAPDTRERPALLLLVLASSGRRGLSSESSARSLSERFPVPRVGLASPHSPWLPVNTLLLTLDNSTCSPKFQMHCGACGITAVTPPWAVERGGHV